MDLKEWINPRFLQEGLIAHSRDAFVNAKPFAHLVLQDFLQEDKLKQVFEGLSQELFYPKESDLFQFRQTEELAPTTNPRLAALRDMLYSDAFINLMQQLTGCTLNPKAVNLFGSLYKDTNFLLCHDDQLPGRKIAFLLYLSTLKKSEGGSLNLFSSQEGKPTAVAKKIIPQTNTFACFEVSDHSFHEVEEVIGDAERVAITGWFHA